MDFFLRIKTEVKRVPGILYYSIHRLFHQWSFWGYWGTVLPDSGHNPIDGLIFSAGLIDGHFETH